MAFLPFPQDQVVRAIAGDSDHALIAKITPSVNTELKYIRPLIYMEGVPTNETAQVAIHTSINTARNYAISNSVQLADFSEGTNTIGFLRFDFNREILNSNFNYYISFKTQNYTKVTGSLVIYLVFDYPNTINLNETATMVLDYPKAFQLFGYEDN